MTGKTKAKSDVGREVRMASCTPLRMTRKKLTPKQSVQSILSKEGDDEDDKDEEDDVKEEIDGEAEIENEEGRDGIGDDDEDDDDEDK